MDIKRSTGYNKNRAQDSGILNNFFHFFVEFNFSRLAHE